jgi:hypothetical protein
MCLEARCVPPMVAPSLPVFGNANGLVIQRTSLRGALLRFVGGNIETILSFEFCSPSLQIIINLFILPPIRLYQLGFHSFHPNLPFSSSVPQTSPVMGQIPSSGIGKCLLDNVPNNLVALSNKIDFMLSDVKQYNLAIPVSPTAVTYPNSTDHVSAIIQCANTWNMKVQARSGGHSYGNYGM